MNHYVYKIINIITNEYYIGVRSCKCNIEEDKYMGSSTIWTKAYIKEHILELKKELLILEKMLEIMKYICLNLVNQITYV